MTATTLRRALLAAATLMLGAGLATSAMAETQWQKTHPRRHEVNHRLNKQNHRIHQEVKEVDLSKQQAAQLHKDDHQIRQEERDMASQDKGHITKQEKRSLNQQENAVSKQIGK
jgi:Spy/CpxP family protein refolding chaperone